MQNSLRSCPLTRVSTLPNGFRIASQNLETPTSTVGIWLDTGSRFENDLTNGTAHFLEHMIFKGTTKRSKTALESSIENMGAHLNAYTSREQTVYYAQVCKENIGSAVEILADILQNSLLQPEAIESERSVILREMEEVNKNMEEVVFDHLHAVAYQGTPLARTILGPKENILSINRDYIKSYIDQHYTATRMVLVAAGGVSHDDLVALAEKHFGSIPARNPSSNTFQHYTAVHPAIYTGADVSMRDDTIENAYVAMAVEGVSWNSPDYWPLLIAQSVIGSWDRSIAGAPFSSSRLAQVVSGRNYAQSYMSFNTSYSDTGLFGIYFVSDRKYALQDLVFEILQEWTRLCLAVTDAEVNRAKNQLKTNLLMGLDGTSPVAEDIGRQMLTLGKRIDIEEVFSIIDKVDAKIIKAVASQYLYDRCPVVSAFGAIETMPDYNEIRASTMWLRN